MLLRLGRPLTPRLNETGTGMYHFVGTSLSLLYMLYILSIYAYVCTIIYTPILILHTIIYTYIYATFNAYTAFMPCLLYDSILYFTMLTIIYFICNAMSARHVRLWAPGCVIGPACMDGLRAHPPCVPSMRPQWPRPYLAIRLSGR